MGIRHFINAMDDRASRVWVAVTKQVAQTVVDGQSANQLSRHGTSGRGVYLFYDPEIAKENSEIDEEDLVVLEFYADHDAKLLDLEDRHDRTRFKRITHGTPSKNIEQELVDSGIDGVHLEHDDEVCFFNTDVLRFARVWSGVISDPLEHTHVDSLDEFALGGLKRCTAVTVNALLKNFMRPLITLNDVPIDSPGVLRILDQRRLGYRPEPNAAGRSVLQFVNMHRNGAWYLLTPHHAMALINGELFDAENRGPDSRRLEAAFLITRR